MGNVVIVSLSKFTTIAHVVPRQSPEPRLLHVCFRDGRPGSGAPVVFREQYARGETVPRRVFEPFFFLVVFPCCLPLCGVLHLLSLQRTTTDDLGARALVWSVWFTFFIVLRSCVCAPGRPKISSLAAPSTNERSSEVKVVV